MFRQLFVSRATVHAKSVMLAPLNLSTAALPPPGPQPVYDWHPGRDQQQEGSAATRSSAAGGVSDTGFER